jgi:uncharacterized membrane protein
MNTSRMEAFSDGVIDVIITIMVLEFEVPKTPDLAALASVLPTFLAYVLSFVYVGIYWSNHHHLLQAADRVNGPILWANLHLLFWLSLIPFTTAWMGENHFVAWPTAIYGIVLLLAAIAYYILAHALMALHGGESALARALGRDWKNIVSAAIYVAAIPLAFVSPLIADALYLAVAIIWLVPDRRIERGLAR